MPAAAVPRPPCPPWCHSALLCTESEPAPPSHDAHVRPARLSHLSRRWNRRRQGRLARAPPRPPRATPSIDSINIKNLMRQRHHCRLHQRSLPNKRQYMDGSSQQHLGGALQPRSIFGNDRSPTTTSATPPHSPHQDAGDDGNPNRTTVTFYSNLSPL
jgi:hypothetical protein